MARYRHLPIWKAALELAVHLECAVRRFPRYHKYTLGSELRQTAQRLCRLVLTVEEMKTLLTHIWLPRWSVGARIIHPRDLPALRGRLKRAGQAHALATQTGHHKTGFKRRELVLFWRPATSIAASFLASSTGVTP